MNARRFPLRSLAFALLGGGSLAPFVTEEIHREPRSRFALSDAVRCNSIWVSAAADIDADGVRDFFLAGNAIDEENRLRTVVEVRSGKTDELKFRFSTDHDARVRSFCDLDDQEGVELLSLEGKKHKELRVRSGRDGRVLFPVELPHNPRSFVPVSDIDDDGVDEIAICTDGSKLLIASGRDGSVLASLSNEVEVRVGFGMSLCALDDLDGDGLIDFAVGEPPQRSNKILGRVLVFSSADLKPLTVLTELGDARSSRGNYRGFGCGLARVHDVDGDGTQDLAISDFDENCVEIFSPRSGKLLRRIESPGESWHRGLSRFGEVVRTAGDFDGDGADDFLVSNSDWNDSGNPGIDRGRVWIFSGSTRQVLAAIGGERTYDGLGRGFVAYPGAKGLELVIGTKADARRFVLE